MIHALGDDRKPERRLGAHPTEVQPGLGIREQRVLDPVSVQVADEVRRADTEQRPDGIHQEPGGRAGGLRRWPILRAARQRSYGAISKIRNEGVGVL
jgi:hypothetical protein